MTAQPNRRPNSLRKSGFDYSSACVYMVTICTHRRVCVLGEIANAVFIPSAPGSIVRECWFELLHHYSRLQLGVLTIMPNHLHGVLAFTDPIRAGLRPAPTTLSTQPGLSEVVRAFKAFSARRINELKGVGGTLVWQRGFHDRIVRNSDELSRVHRYMEENPAQWQFDAENPNRRKQHVATASVRASAAK